MTEDNGGEGNNERALQLGVGVAVGARAGTAFSVALDHSAFLAVGIRPGLISGNAIGATRPAGDGVSGNSPRGLEDAGTGGGP